MSSVYRSKKTGLVLWRARVQDVYKSVEELRGYANAYNVVRRCGFRSAKAMWDANPMLQGSTEPSDFGLANARPRQRRAK